MPTLRRLVAQPWFWFLLFALYAVSAAALRLASRDTVIGDDAESFLWARSLAWGYGPQPPLYAWLHWVVMQVAGETALASAATRAIAQFLVPCGVFLLSRRFAPTALAGAATLAVFIVPEIGRVFPVTRTHNILATALSPVVALTFLMWLDRQRAGLAILFGAVSALAILSKATAALLVVSLPVAALLVAETRARLRADHLGLALAVLALILLPPGLWLVQNLETGTSSLAKFKTDVGAQDGLYWLWERMLASWGPTALLTGVAWWATRGLALHPDVRLLWRMGAVSLVAIIVGILVSGSGDIREHWLAPIFLPIVPATIAILVQRQGWLRWLPSTIGGILAVVGLAVLPSEIVRRGFERLDIFRPAIADIQSFRPDLVLGARNAAANVILLDPTLPVRERGDTRPIPCPATVALITVEGAEGRSVPLDVEGFVNNLPTCRAEVLTRVDGVPAPGTRWVSYAVLRLTPAD